MPDFSFDDFGEVHHRVIALDDGLLRCADYGEVDLAGLCQDGKVRVYILVDLGQKFKLDVV